MSQAQLMWVLQRSKTWISAEPFARLSPGTADGGSQPIGLSPARSRVSGKSHC